MRGLARTGVTVGLVVVGGGFVAVGGAASGSVTAPSRPAIAARGLDVLPFPGTPDAAPRTSVDFPAVSPAQIRTITVAGSRSGRHAGRISAQPAGQGTAFSPDRPFAPGERVRVTATLRSSKAATASGAPGHNRITFSFTIARPGAVSGRRTGPEGDVSHSRPLTYKLVTEPTFTPPIVTISGTDTDTTSGDIFLDAQNSGQNAAYILDPTGRLIWYQPGPEQTGGQAVVHDVRVQSYDGKSVLTYWQGQLFGPGGGRGEGVILNHHYQTIHTVVPGNGYRSQGADEHEFVLGHEGSEATAFIAILTNAQANLTSIGGPPNGAVYDWIIQEIDIATGKVIWEWHPLGHVPVSDSYSQYVPGARYDYFHLNSIQQLPDGDILISARNTWGVYLIDKATGRILWRLGGKRSSFKMGPGTNFEWQHDATLLNGGLVTLFDDGAVPPEEKQSRALEIHIGAGRAALVHQYLHSPPTLAPSKGSTQVLRNEGVFVGWGLRPYFSEYSATGTQIFGGSFRAPVNSYRAFRFNWIGLAPQPPAIAVRPASTAGQENVYASWNGSTQIRKWEALSSSSSAGPFVEVGRPTPWSGFETKIQVPTANYFEVEALNARGKVIGTSAPAAG